MSILTTTALVPLRAEDMQEITVMPGETLWGIANRYLKDPRRWPDIVQANNLQMADPTGTLPGSRLRVPVSLIKEEFRNALLVGAIPEVRYRRKGESEWKEAKRDMLLNYEDSLQTLTGAQARVRFPSKEIVQINENSYVVLKPEKILQEVQLLRGDLRASRAKVIMPQGTIVQPKGGTSDYQARIREDETQVVFVYKGKVDVTAKGKTVTVVEGFGTEVPKAAPPLDPKPLSTFKDFNPAEMTSITPPSPLEITKGAVVVSAPKKEIASPSKTLVSKDLLAQYRLQLSNDKTFSQVIIDKVIPTGTAFDLKKESVPDGNYFMRVAFIDAEGRAAQFSRPSEVVKDTQPPKILTLVPEEGQKFSGDESYCDVMGTVEDAAMIAVNDEVLFISPTGRFNKFLTLQEGQNPIKVIARDVHGNETVMKRTVIYSKDKRN
jgi:hypothetical protein